MFLSPTISRSSWLALAILGAILPPGIAWAQTPPDSTNPPAVSAPEELPQPRSSINNAIRVVLNRAGGSLATLDAYYASRNDAPIWLVNGQWTPQAHTALDRIQHAAEDGIDLSAYRTAPLSSGPDATLALADVALSRAVAAYASQASGGRIDPTQISELIDSKPSVVSLSRALDEVSRATDGDYALHAFNPEHAGYIALRNKLAQADEAEKSDIIVNMEFWRWLPRTLGPDRIVVNIPEFTARLYHNDAEAQATRVIVGKPDHATPIFSNEIKYLIVNPTWNIPDSIVNNEMAADPAALERQGYDVDYVDGHLHVSQPPGARNALGRIKFMFPNKYSVYLHDTPTKTLFSKQARALSHGCVRVDQPFVLAEGILGAENGWSQARLKEMVGHDEEQIDLGKPLPIHIVYFTLTVDADGKLHHFNDIYGYDKEARQILGFGEAAAAE